MVYSSPFPAYATCTDISAVAWSVGCTQLWTTRKRKRKFSVLSEHLLHQHDHHLMIIMMIMIGLSLGLNSVGPGLARAVTAAAAAARARRAGPVLV